MSLLPGTQLTPHFLASELNASAPEANDAVVSNLRRVAEYLELVRTEVGSPLLVNSGFRTPEHNARVGGSSTSSHLQGLAADITAQSVPFDMMRQRIENAARGGRLPQFDQIIFYPLRGFVHIGLGPKMRNEIIENRDGTYFPVITLGKIAGAGSVTPMIALVTILAVLLAFVVI